MIPGIHIHYSKVAVNDPYINNGIPDSRTNHVREFILSEPLDDSSTIITIEGNRKAYVWRKDDVSCKLTTKLCHL